MHFIALLAAEPEETAGTRRRDLEDLRSLTLPRIAAAANLQTEILALSAPEHRATLTHRYLPGFDERYNEVIGPGRSVNSSSLRARDTRR